jgi:Ca2+:H+ antiporter
VAVLTVLAAVGRYVTGFSAVAAFILATLALAGMAWLVSFATGETGRRLGPGPTGVLQATLGNLPEFFVVLFALNAGQLIVAQTALIGSIVVNALFVLGLVILAGVRASRDGTMRFSRRLPNDTATLLLISTFIIVLVALTDVAGDPASHHAKTISIVGAAAILVVYGLWLRQYLRSHGAPADTTPPRLSQATALGLLIAGGVGAAFVSDWFVHALTPTIHTLHISRAFAGLVIVAIAGNAVEHVVGVAMAAKGESELAISVVKNSVAQIAAFLFPALVLVSLLTSTTLTFAMSPVYAGALFGTAVIIWQVTGDGEAREFEGAALIAAYVILATVAAFQA